MGLSKDTVAEVKDRADIVEVIGERVRLANSGSDYVGLCPFHAEKTPSFRVNPSWRTYHCFGCGVGGSVVDFVMAIDGLTFPEALAALAERFGVALPNAPAQPGAGRSLEVLKAARDYYQQLLVEQPQGERARRYLRGRGFEEAEWEAFSLGFAPDAWQGFLDHARTLGYDQEAMVDSGLVKLGQAGRAFDMLRDRVVFPILDPRGRPIAFGGRIMDGDGPKYINTPETRHYHKSKVLFGLAQAQAALRQSKRALLVEGYLDVMRLHQHGFAEAVATCGTALTGEHVKLLERTVESVVLLFDGDDAGIKAALRSAPLFLNGGIEARVVLLPDRLDPDDFLVQRGAEAMQTALDHATPLLEFLVVQLLRQNGDSLQGRERTVEALVPLLAQVGKPAARDLAVRYLADLVGIDTATVLGMMRSHSHNPNRGRDVGGSSSSGGAAGGRGLSDTGPLPMASGLVRRQGRHQRRFLRLVLNERHLIPRARELLPPEDLSEPSLRALWEKLLGFANDELERVSLDELMEWYPQQAPILRELLLEDALAQSALSDGQRQLEHEVLRIKEESKERLFERCRQLTGSAEEEAAVEQYRRLRDELATLKTGFRSTHALRPEQRLRAGYRPSTGPLAARRPEKPSPQSGQ